MDSPKSYQIRNISRFVDPIIFIKKEPFQKDRKESPPREI